jgi:tetratricopeptide (TPR) repeat protein
MSDYIWSLSQLQELVDHPEPSVQEWAVDKWFFLYPESAQESLAELLGDSRRAVVAAALSHLGVKRRDELVPVLKDIYLHGALDASAEAIRVLGEWQVEEAVDWMKQRILDGTGLKAEQIANMIYALGQIPSDAARNLLKSTEISVSAGGFRHWANFYVALLNHRQPEDVDAIVAVLMDASKKDRHLEAFGVLLSVIDPYLNPTEVFYGNFTQVDKHILRRLGATSGGLTPEEVAELVADVPKTWSELAVAERLAALASFRRRLEDHREALASTLEYQIAQKTAAALEAGDGVSDDSQAPLALAWLALAAALAPAGTREPAVGDDWQHQLRYLMRSEPPRPGDEVFVEQVIQTANRATLIEGLRAVLRDDPGSWQALRAMLMVGELKAAEALPELLRCIALSQDRFGHEAIHLALTKMVEPAIVALIPLLGSADPAEKRMAWNVLGHLPTEEGVKAQLAHLPEYYREDAEQALEMVRLSGAKEFLPFVETEYRPQESALGRAYVHLCRVNGTRTERLAEIERDVKRMQESEAAQGEWPRVVALELACTQCGKPYHYDVREIHLHPPDKGDSESGTTDLIPFHHGIVIRDDIQCKNCGTTNAVHLTQRSRQRLTAEFVKILAYARSGQKIPSSFPIKLTNWPTGNEPPQTLRGLERDRLQSLEDHPTKPAAHLALGKFYEYVKEDARARKAYLRALDLDTRCLEAMAGLARTDHTSGRLKEALEWVESCYEQLETGSYYLVEDRAAFKKATRDARREFARELGVKPKEAQVDIRFHLETSEHPKNRPCPCGSGKKYKMCCMPREKE